MNLQKLSILGIRSSESDTILSPKALEFISELEETFGSRRRQLLEKRQMRQCDLDAGTLPDFLPATEDLRKSRWRVAEPPEDLRDRRVEITGPVDRKMIINALNSGAKVFMADFEDSHSPTWVGTMQGQANLVDAVRKTIRFSAPDGKEYVLNSTVATLMVRPRGWHLEEKHVRWNGQPISASLFDFGLYFFHNAHELRNRGTGPYYYLPKLENHLEARLWNDVFVHSQQKLGLPKGSIRATVLIETILAAFEMHEILYELRDHSAGLNCGRWDYIFSFIKKFRNRPDFLLPDRHSVTMQSHFLKSYSELVIQTCHRRGIHAMGGMAAQIPVKNDPRANETALEKVRADKEREVRAGHDGTWVAHPALVSVAMQVFDAQMKKANQIHITRDDVSVTASDLLSVPEGLITENGLRNNVSVGVQYLQAWLCGNGCVPLYNLMEDAATAEIARAQLWQWIHNANGKLADGRKIDSGLFSTVLREELGKIKARMGDEAYRQSRFTLAADIFEEITSAKVFTEFLTLPAYQHIVDKGAQ
jgi:malate synthase